jgi:hypothetical protein
MERRRAYMGIGASCNSFHRQGAMMICYLDDSGTDSASPILTMAGYVGAEPRWAAFEQSAKKIFADFDVALLHGKEFNDTKGQFKGWTRKKKEAFIARLYLEHSQCCQLWCNGLDCKSRVCQNEEFRRRSTTVAIWLLFWGGP